MDAIARRGRIQFRILFPYFYKQSVNQHERHDPTPSLPRPLPDVNPRSRHYNEDVLKNDVGIKLNDKEYNYVLGSIRISEGWIAVASGKALDRKGNPLTIKLKGKVEAFYK